MLRRGVWVLMMVLAVGVFSQTAFALNIDGMNGSLGQTQWYDGASDSFQAKHLNGLDPAPISILEISTVNSSGVEYVMFGGDFDISSSALLDDQTAGNAGGRALGVFGLGATLTLSGILYDQANFVTPVADGILFTADIVYDWELEEQESPPYPQNTVRGHAFFDVTGGLLSDGSLNTAGLVLQDFWLHFTFDNSAPTVTDFINMEGVYTSSSPDVQFAPIPEPVSIALWGLTSLALVKMRRRYSE